MICMVINAFQSKQEMEKKEHVGKDVSTLTFKAIYMKSSKVES